MEQEAAGNHAFSTAQCWGSSLGGIWILWFMARCWQTQLHWHWNSRKDINKDINQPRLTKKTDIVFTLGPGFREDPWLVSGGLKNHKNGRFEKIHIPTFGVEFTIHNQYEPLIHDPTIHEESLVLPHHEPSFLVTPTAAPHGHPRHLS